MEGTDMGTEQIWAVSDIGSRALGYGFIYPVVGEEALAWSSLIIFCFPRLGIRTS